MPLYDVVERHHVHVNAPPGLVLATACSLDLLSTPLASVMFKAREIVMGARSSGGVLPRGLMKAAQAIGWRVLAELPEREVVLARRPNPGTRARCSTASRRRISRASANRVT
jgi:hypothetical protein